MPRPTDEGTVEAITETPAMRYILGLEEFVRKEPFDPSLTVHFGKRFGVGFIETVNRPIIDEGSGKDAQKGTNADEDSDSSRCPSHETSLSPKGSDENDPGSKTARKGRPIVDATCTPADIRYPTDLGLSNGAGEKSEEIVDVLFKHNPRKTKKPRTYRQKARKQYLGFAERKKSSTKPVRKGCGRQLRYLKRNPKHIEKPNEMASSSVSSRRQYKNLLAIHELYRQRQTMYETKIRSIPSRIVSIAQPRVRPIGRGKASAQTEFGAKLSASASGDGYATLDRLSWEAYSESGDLENRTEKYRSRTGHCPKSVLADKLYRTRENRQW